MLRLHSLPKTSVITYFSTHVKLGADPRVGAPAPYSNNVKDVKEGEKKKMRRKKKKKRERRKKKGK